LQIYYAVYHKDAFGSYVRDLEWCKLVNNLKTAPILDFIVKEIKAFGKDPMEVCSRTGIFTTFANSGLISKVPPGDFLINIKLFDETDSNIINVMLYLVVGR
jgi:hypothetical protein